MSLGKCCCFVRFYLPLLQFVQMRLGQRFVDPVSLSPPTHLYLKKKKKPYYSPLCLWQMAVEAERVRK